MRARSRRRADPAATPVSNRARRVHNRRYFVLGRHLREPTMRLALSLVASVSGVLMLSGPATIRAHAQTATALTGLVSSSEDGTLEGVLVSAKKDGATITTTVVSDKDGRYSFPAERMAPS